MYNNILRIGIIVLCMKTAAVSGQAAKSDCKHSNMVSYSPGEPPMFDKGKGGMIKWLSQRIDSLKLNDKIKAAIDMPLDSTIVLNVDYTVSKTGKISKAEVCCERGCFVSELGVKLKLEIEKLFFNMPDWSPAMYHDSPVHYNDSQQLIFEFKE